MGPSGDPLQDLCTMLGLMTFSWAHAENMLALTIGIIGEHVGPMKGHPEAPLMLKRRVDCLRVALRDVEVLKPLQQEGRMLMERFMKLSVRRNDFVHGAAWQLNESTYQSISFAVIDGKYAPKYHRFDQGDTVSLNAEIAKLSEDAVAFMQKTAAAFAK